MKKVNKLISPSKMKYLEKVGIRARKAFEEMKAVKHSKIQLVLKNYNTAIIKNKKIFVK